MLRVLGLFATGLLSGVYVAQNYNVPKSSVILEKLTKTVSDASSSLSGDKKDDS